MTTKSDEIASLKNQLADLKTETARIENEIERLSNPTFPYEMTFEELCEIHRNEMKTRALMPCRPDLYKAMRDLIDKLEAAYCDQVSKDPDSVETQGAALRFKNAKSIRKVIVSMRAKKVLNKAILVADGGNQSLEGMAPEERSLFNEVCETATLFIKGTQVSRCDNSKLYQAEPEKLYQRAKYSKKYTER